MQIWFKIPQTGLEPEVDRRCRSCGWERVHVHQHERFRGIVDWKLDTIRQVRVKCPRCGKTATCRPAGVSAGAHRTEGVRAFGILLYVLGLSYGAAGAAIRSLTGSGSKSTVYRDVVSAGEAARRLHEHRKGKAVRVLGVDGTGQRMKRGGRGRSVGVAFAVDAEEHTLLGVELVDEENERQVRRFVERLCRDYSVAFLITDEHASYAAAARSRRVQAEHRLCEAHWKKSKLRRIRTLRDAAQKRGFRQMVRDLDLLRRLVRDRPDDAPRRIERIHRRTLHCAPPPPGASWTLGYHLRMLTLHLLETWHRVGTDTQPTNNTAERTIGLLKIRSKTMRGFVQPDHILRFVHLAAHIHEGRPFAELRAAS